MKTSRALVLTGLVVLSAVLASAEVAVTEDGVEKADTAAESLEISHCIDSVVFGLNLTNFPCMKLLIVKALGMVVIAGSFTYKVPQIQKLLKAGDATGVSLMSTYIETACYMSVMVFHLLQGNPVSAWGENAIITVQQVVLVLVLWKYNKCSALHIFLVAAGFAVMLTVEYSLPADQQSYIFSATIPAFSGARIPQIIENFRNGHTGQLALITLGMGFFGSIARVITSLAEVKDLQVALSFVLGFVWNAILLVQMLVYWNKTNQVMEQLAAKKKAEKTKKTE